MIKLTKNEKEILLEALDLYYIISFTRNMTNKPRILRDQIQTLKNKIMIIGIEFELGNKNVTK